MEISDYVGAFSVCITYILGDIIYVGAFNVCATYILEISDYVGAFSVCATYILEIPDYVGLFSVCVTYIFYGISDYVGVFIVLVTYISSVGRIWITSECLFKVYFDETRLCSVLRIFGRKEFVYVGAFCARRYFLKVCAKCILEE